MATSAISAHGTQLKVGDGADPEVFTTIAEVKDISGPPQTMDTEEVTNHDSGGWKEYIPTLLDAGEVTFDVNYTGDTSQTSLRTDQQARTLRTWNIVIPFDTPETLEFSGYITNFSYNFPVAGVASGSLTIKVTGAITSTTA